MRLEEDGGQVHLYYGGVWVIRLIPWGFSVFSIWHGIWECTAIVKWLWLCIVLLLFVILFLSN